MTKRKLAGTTPLLVYASLTLTLNLAHFLLFNDSAGLAYYGTAMLFDFAAIEFAYLSLMTTFKRIAFMCVWSLSFAANFTALVCWIAYIKHADTYNMVIYLLYFCAIMILLLPGGGGHGSGRRGTILGGGNFRWHWPAHNLLHLDNLQKTHGEKE